MKMESDPLSCFIEATKTTAGGVFAFFLGLMGGSIIVFSQWGACSETWTWYAVAWLALIPFTIAKLWGLLLAPLLGVLFLGLIWKEWNRAIGASLVAILLSTTTLLSADTNPFMDFDDGMSFLLTMGTAVLILLLGIAWEWLKRKAPTQRPETTDVPPMPPP